MTHDDRGRRTATTGLSDGTLDGAGALFHAGADKVRFATILFADLVASTRLVAALDPEDARDVLDKALRVATDAVHRFGGTVARVQGDGIMAIFGVMPTVEDHALRAALAGLAIVEEMRGGAVGVVPSPQFRVGIHSGLVLLRRQHADFGSILDVVGQAAHVAGQVEKRAAANSVAVSASTLELIGEPCRVRLLEPVAVADGSEPLAVSALESIELARGDWLPVKGNGQQALVGREAAMAAIDSLIRDIGDGAGGSLLITGEAGMGKSRLLVEAARASHRRGLRFVAVRGNELVREAPFAALKPALRHLVELLGSENGGSRAEAALSPHERECLAGLLEGSGAWLASLSPSERLRIAGATFTAVLAMAARMRPLAVLIDDFQYIDNETRTLLVGLAGRARGGAFGLILAQRPGEREILTAVVDRALALDPLGEAEARTLIRAIAGNQVLPPEAVAMIAERACGLPLALDEFTTLALRGPPDDRDAAGARLPARLESLFVRRLDELDGDPALLCQLCAAMGPTVPLERLERLAPELDGNLDAALATLVERRVIALDIEGQARFTHQLVQEAAYRTLSRAEQRDLHARIHGRLVGPDLPPLSEGVTQAELATHAERGGLLEAALRHLWKAAEQAVALAAIESVNLIWERARSLAERIGGPGGAQARARFALLSLDALQQLSLEQAARSDMEALVAGAVDLGPDLRTIARINLALLDWIDGNPLRARVQLEAAELELARNESLPRRTYADIVGAYIDYSLAEPIAALDRIDRLTSRLREAHATESFGAVVVIPHILALSFGGWYAADLGQSARAEAWIAEALEIAQAQGHNYSHLLADLACGFAHYRGGRIDAALEVLRKAHGHCLQHRFFGFEPACASWLALCLIERGLLDEARAVLGASVAGGHYLRVKTSATYYHFEARTRLALADGDHAAAIDLAGQALDHCRAVGEAMHEHHALVLREEVLAASGCAPDPAHIAERAVLAARLAALGLGPLEERLRRLAGVGEEPT